MSVSYNHTLALLKFVSNSSLGQEKVNKILATFFRACAANLSFVEVTSHDWMRLAFNCLYHNSINNCNQSRIHFLTYFSATQYLTFT